MVTSLMVLFMAVSKTREQNIVLFCGNKTSKDVVDLRDCSITA